MLNLKLALRFFVISLFLLSSCATIVQPSTPPQSNPVKSDQRTDLVEIAKKLLSYKILTEQDYPILVDQINQGNVANRANLLEFLGRQAERRLNANLPQQGFVEYVFVGKLDQKELDRLKSIAQQLKESGAISDRVYRKVQRKIGTTFQIDFQIYSFVGDWMAGDDALEPEKIQPFLDDLQRLGLITKENRAKLSNDLNTAEAEDKYAIAHYLENTKVFNLRDYSRDPKVYFPQIHQEVAQLLKKVGAIDLSAARFKVDLLSKDLGYYTETNALISTEVEGRKYELTSFYAPSIPQGSFLGMIESEKFVQIFNKILRDQKSPYRVYTLGYLTDEYGATGVDYSRFAVLVLTEEQAKQLQRWSYSYLAIRLEDHSSTFKSDRIQAILDRLEAIGLLSHLTPQQKAKGKQKIAQQYINSSYELLSAFDNLMISFDWETGNLEDPYRSLTERFAAASRGAFNPSRISDEFDLGKGVAGLFFFVNGIRYGSKLKFNGDWLDPEFITLIDRAVAETVSDGKFYELYDGSGVEGYLFLTNQQRKALEAENLVQLAPKE